MYSKLVPTNQPLAFNRDIIGGLTRVQKTAAGAVFETGKTGPVNR
jgi:hypothetical protein